MDGWLGVQGASVRGDDLFCAQYGEADLPGYWAYARAYGLADHFFANVLGPSFPGHAFVVAGQAAWAVDNPSAPALGSPYWGCDDPAGYRIQTLMPGSRAVGLVRPCFDIPSVPTLLPAGTDWRFYGTVPAGRREVFSVFDAIEPVRSGALWGHVVSASTFEQDVRSGRLPAVTWVVDEDGSSEHPGGAGVCAGENWTIAHVNALMQSPLWKDSAVLITMDDFGGWYDHVAPPRRYGGNATQPYGLGFRLPLIVLSPYVKRGVYDGITEQASIARFILDVFDARAYLSDLDPAAQDEQAGDLREMFDWSQPPLAPLVLPQRSCPSDAVK